MKLNFTKMQGAGNDYIYIDCRAAGLPPDAAAWAVQLSRRHFSVGADGVIYLCPPLRADGDAAMRMFNADGSEGVMCGNGVRCAAEFLYTHGVRRDCIRIDTPSAGQRVLHRVGDGLWQVEMGRFTAAPDAVGAVGLGGGPLLDVPLCAGGRTWRVHCVAVGNPHCVLFTHEPPPTGSELVAWGRALGRHPAFPGGINVEFAQPISPTGLAVTLWERGTMAGLRDRGLRRGRGGGADRPLSARRAHFSTASGRHAGGVCTARRHRAFDRRRRSNI